MARTWAVWPRVRGYQRPAAYARRVLVNRHRSLLRRAVVESLPVTVRLDLHARRFF